MVNLKKFFPCMLIGAVLILAWQPASAKKRWDAPKLVTANCSGCHGIDGNAQLPYIPRLAGLSASYEEKKLADFREPVHPSTDELVHRIFKPQEEWPDEGNTHQARVNMIGISVSTDLAQLKAAVFWYEKQTPAPGSPARPELVSRGRWIFTRGVPSQHIVACKVCHGENAQGTPQAPRLAGQNGDYLVNQLAKFRKGDRKHSPEMTEETRDLNEPQARATAAFLQSQ